MNRVLLPLADWDGIAGRVSEPLGAKLGQLTMRRFPDGESYVRIESDVKGQEVILLASLADPDDKILKVLYTAALAMDLGAASVRLIAPYLPYMRQDTRFQPGEAVTSTYFARLLSNWVDGIVTVDPHLHRRSSLGEIYSVPTHVAHAAPLISAWIRQKVDKPLLIGPDEESAQWVAAVAADADAPHIVLEKTRRGDRDVDVSVPQVDKWRGATPVLVDDIISTARTMIETVGHLKDAGLAPPICIGVHGLFAGTAYSDLQESGVARIVTSNTVPHETNAIDVSGLLAAGLGEI